MKNIKRCGAIITMMYVVSFVISLPVAATQCDCNHFPWPPECVNSCGALILSHSSTAELTTFLHLDNSTAQKLVSFRARKPEKNIESLKEVRSVLSSDEFKELSISLSKLKPLEAEYLVANSEKKKDFREMVLAAPPREDPAGPPHEKQ